MAWSSTVLAHTFIALRLPSGSHKVLKISPNTSISLGKYGSFPANQLIGRPFYLTFEIVDGDGEGGQTSAELRVVPPEEIHIEALAEDGRGAQSDLRDDTAYEEDAADSFDVVGPNGELLIRNNRLTIDDPARQALTMEEIEALKKTAPGSGKDIIAKIMQSHSALDEKTAFSLAKYTLRKSKKYLRRFTLLPLDVSTLTSWMLYEKEPARILEIREEMLGLLCSWANIRHSPSLPQNEAAGARWLVVDDTGGLIVAALAERMGVLYPTEHEDQYDEDVTENANDSTSHDANENGDYTESLDEPDGNADNEINEEHPRTEGNNTSGFFSSRRRQKRHAEDAMSANSNSITLIHAANQPNISLLAYFGYNPTETSIAEPYPAFKHPLHTHLKTLSWLQLLSPESDGAYIEPEYIDPDALASLKTSKRGNYYRKRRRWECTKRVVDETRLGKFDGLVVASTMEPTSILHHTVPLLSGGAPVVVYSPYVEPLAELMDIYSSSRRAAYISQSKENTAEVTCPSEDFPADPRLLLGASLQTARATEWQVLPGRTHPLMTGRGGAEGYLFTATRVLPIEGVVEARGRFSKKRKTAAPETDANGI